VGTITVWMIVVLMNSGHRVELSDTHPSELECLAAAQAIQGSHRGASATCVPRPIALSEDQAKRLSSEDWWRNRPREAEADRKP
jgi:hypothetical protein